MKAAVFTANGDLRILAQEKHEPAPGWVRVAVTAVGICGSDLHIKHGLIGSPEGLQPGHEIAGVIDVPGEGVELAAGTPVSIEPIISCGHCHCCHVGQPNLCAEVGLFGVTRPGAMAEYINVPAHTLYPVPRDLSAGLTALAEPMAVCTRGVRIGNIGIGERVVVLGAGSIGLLSIVAARAAGAGEVVITARHPHQQALARALGATQVFMDAEALVRGLGESYADVVIETVGGSADTLTESVRVARPGAIVVMLGIFEGHARLPGLPFITKELTLAASNCYGHEAAEADFKVAKDLVSRFRDQLAPLITHRFKLDQVNEAFHTAEDKASRSIKVQIYP